ncbi:MAG: hypothetical protein P4M11_02720 [Candidatus Pacebacteria bacterium]|nr:hypothetical protein [Candidatus Paceibacterota bacterium]
MLRDGAADFFRLLLEKKLHCYIVSGGIRSVMNQCLSMLAIQKDIENIESCFTICATEEKYDEAGRLVSFLEPRVTSVDKADSLTHEKFPEIKLNVNALVVGDYILDLHAGDNLNLKTTLSIGFFNGRGDGTLNEYLLAYDIVVLGDGSYRHVADIVRKIISGDTKCSYRQVTTSAEYSQFFTKL